MGESKDPRLFSIMTPEVFKQSFLLLQLVEKNRPNADLIVIEKAIAFAYNAHQGQFRSSGEPYVMHPISVATILAEQGFDTISIITALLHDTVEDTAISCTDIAKEFSVEIANLVDGVTKLAKIDYQPIHVRQAENFRKLLLAMSKDIRVLLVKLADRIHNMRTISSLNDKEKHLRIAHETMEVYGPLADRMGMYQFKNELEDLAFAVIYPEIRKSVQNRLDFLSSKDQFLIQITKEKLIQLISEKVAGATIIGRQKTPYSIWKKMEKKKISFDQLSDIIAFRVLVPNIEDCYKVLGLVHLTYKVMITGFKDYISLPKSNGYQSLHTLVIGHNQQLIEIQIRTYEMDELVQFGMAAHWAYKNSVVPVEIDPKQFKWINELIDVLKHTSSAEEVLENTRLDLYNDQVFCFTVEGDLISLPKGATAVDFAFFMHSDIGLKCSGAKINGRISNLNQPLENGDQVEILTNPSSSPSPSWENFVVTGKARSAIRKFIRNTKQFELVNLGRIILIKALEKTKCPYNELDLLPLLKIFQKRTIDDLLFAVGRGLIVKTDVIQAIYSQANIDQKTLKKSLSIFKRDNSNQEKSIPIQGLIPGTNTVFAQCCSPIPGDRIVGIIHPAQGIIVHAVGCNILSGYTDHPEKWINLIWDAIGNELYIGKILISISNSPGSLFQVTKCIKDADCNIINVRVSIRNIDIFQIIVELEVSSIKQINSIIGMLKNCESVYSVNRFINQK